MEERRHDDIGDEVLAWLQRKITDRCQDRKDKIPHRISNRIPFVATKFSNQYISAENISRQNDNTLSQRLVLYCSSRLPIDHHPRRNSPFVHSWSPVDVSIKKIRLMKESFRNRRELSPTSRNCSSRTSTRKKTALHKSDPNNHTHRNAYCDMNRAHPTSSTNVTSSEKNFRWLSDL